MLRRLTLLFAVLLAGAAWATDDYNCTITSTGSSVNSSSVGACTFRDGSLLSIQCSAAAYVQRTSSSGTTSSATGTWVGANQLYTVSMPTGAQSANRYLAVISVSGTAACKVNVISGVSLANTLNGKLFSLGVTCDPTVSACTFVTGQAFAGTLSTVGAITAATGVAASSTGLSLPDQVLLGLGTQWLQGVSGSNLVYFGHDAAASSMHINTNTGQYVASSSGGFSSGASQYYTGSIDSTAVTVVSLTGFFLSMTSSSGAIHFRNSATPSAGVRAVRLGFSTAEASVNAAAEILSVENGLGNGGTPVQKVAVLGTGKLSWTSSEFTDDSANTGNRTVNKVSGINAFAGGATAITITNDRCSATSAVVAILQTNDATAILKNVVPAAGSFTINLSAAATGTTKVAWVVLN